MCSQLVLLINCQREWRTGQAYTGFGEETGSEKDHMEDLSVDWRMLLKWILNGMGEGTD